MRFYINIYMINIKKNYIKYRVMAEANLPFNTHL